MTRFGILTVILLIGFIAALGGATAYGRAHSEPNRLQALGFDMCGDKACWKGITPGLSSWDATSAIGTALGGKVLINGSDVRMQFHDSGYEVTAIGIKDKQLATYIGVSTVNSSNTAPVDQSKLSTVGDLLNLFGSPCLIGSTDDATEFELLYPDMIATVQSASPTLNSHIGGIAVLDPTLVPNFVTSDLCKSSPMGAYPVQAWRGLTTLDNYLKWRETILFVGD